MREHVRERDRDEREQEVRRERARRTDEPLGDRDRREIGDDDEQDEEGEAGDVGQRRREVDDAQRLVREPRADVGEQVRPGARLAEAVEARGADHHREEEERAGNPLDPCQAREGPAHHERAVARRERRDPGEEPERDRKPSPPRVHASRPNTAIPARAQ